MVALKEEYSTHVAFPTGENTLATVSLRPIRQTIWRRRHDIRLGSAPHFYTGAMTPEATPDNEIRVGYRNRHRRPFRGRLRVRWVCLSRLSALR